MPGTPPRNSHRDLMEAIAQLRAPPLPWRQRLRRTLACLADGSDYPPPWMREAPLLDLVLTAALAQPYRLARWVWKRAYRRARHHGKQRRQARLDAARTEQLVG